MRERVQLPGDGGVDPRMVVAVEIGPDGGIAVEIFAAPTVAQSRPLAGNDDGRFVLRARTSRASA